MIASSIKYKINVTYVAIGVHLGDCQQRVGVHPLSQERLIGRTHLGNLGVKIMKNISMPQLNGN
jgi:hypothetical protein